MNTVRPAFDGSTQRVVLTILREGPISRADLARRLGLSTASLTRLTKPLVASGLARECDEVLASWTGRPSRPLDLDASAAHFVGATIISDAVHLVCVDLKGRVVDSRVHQGGTDSPDESIGVIEQWCQQMTSAGMPPAALGISLGAPVDSGTIPEPPFVPWPSIDLAARARRLTGRICVVDNDANAFTIAEHWFGAGRGLRDFAVITTGLGLGLGVVSNDELVRGHHGAAGEIELLELPGGGLVRDSLQTRELLERFEQRLGRPVCAAEIVQLGSLPECADIVTGMAHAAGHLAAIMTIFTAPEAVLISGESAALLEGHVGEIVEAFKRVTPRAHVPEILISTHGFEEWARGAAALAIQEWMGEGSSRAN